MSGGSTPLLDNVFNIGSVGFVFTDGHFVSDIQFGTADHCFGIMQDFCHHVMGSLGQICDVVAIIAQGFCNFVNGGEYIQISSRADVALVRWKTEDCNR